MCPAGEGAVQTVGELDTVGSAFCKQRAFQHSLHPPSVGSVFLIKKRTEDAYRKLLEDRE